VALRQHIFAASAIAIVLLGAVAAALLLWVRLTFGVWSPLQAPERIALCDMSYTKRDDRAFTRAAAAAELSEPDADSIVLDPTFGALPLVIQRPARFEPGASYNGCGHALLLRVAHDEYVLYFKLGGP
jgi:hypothetical protein